MQKFINNSTFSFIMKIRQIPEDFFVEEIPNLQLVPDGEYKLYRLKKRDLDTFWCLNQITKIHGILRHEIGFAGLKDRHAVTIQYITVPKKYEIAFKNDKLQIHFVGMVEKPLLLGDMEKNHFKIVVRDIKPKETRIFIQKHKIIQAPNYYDSQRFGGIQYNQAHTQPKFIYRHIIKNNYYEAMKLYLTHYSSSDTRDVHKDKKNIKRVWPDVKKAKIETAEFKTIIKKFLSTNDWQQAFEKIDKDQRKFFKSAYLSYLWNECIKELIQRSVKSKDIKIKRYAAGELYFSKFYPKDMPRTFHTIGKSTNYTDLEKEIVSKILQKEEVNMEDFQDIESQERLVLIQPEQYKATNVLTDEKNSSEKHPKKKVTLNFDLPSGSYATIILKYFGVADS
jgi:tRNA pseudouridine13 synthase